MKKKNKYKNKDIYKVKSHIYKMFPHANKVDVRVNKLPNGEFKSFIRVLAPQKKELVASDYIILSSGFEAKLGSTFRAAPSISNVDITCMPNPTQSLALKSDTINNQDKHISSNVVVETQINKVKIYPNPSKGNFKISIAGELSDDAKISIYDTSGILRHCVSLISKNQNIVFTDIPGIYFIKVFNNEITFYEKIILQ